MSLSLQDIWEHTDLMLDQLFLSHNRPIAVGKANYKKAIAATIVSNTFGSYDRNLVNNPGFLEAMNSTTSLAEGIKKLFSNEIGGLFNDLNLMTLLLPYHNYRRDFVYFDGFAIKLNRGHTEVILVDCLSTNLWFKASLKDGGTIYMTYCERSKYYFEVLSFGSESIFKVEISDNRQITITDKYIYLFSSDLKIYSADTFELIKTLTFGARILKLTSHPNLNTIVSLITSDGKFLILKDFEIIFSTSYIQSCIITNGMVYLKSFCTVHVYDLNDFEYLETIETDIRHYPLAVHKNFLFSTNFYDFVSVINTVATGENRFMKIALMPGCHAGTIEIIDGLLYLLQRIGGSHSLISIYNAESLELLEHRSIITISPISLL
jgi:hypothetical protein